MPLDIATPGIIELLLDDEVMGAWEMTRRFGRPVSEADLAAALELFHRRFGRFLFSLDFWNASVPVLF